MQRPPARRERSWLQGERDRPTRPSMARQKIVVSAKRNGLRRGRTRGAPAGCAGAVTPERVPLGGTTWAHQASYSCSGHSCNESQAAADGSCEMGFSLWRQRMESQPRLPAGLPSLQRVTQPQASARGSREPGPEGQPRAGVKTTWNSFHRSASQYVNCSASLIKSWGLGEGLAQW